MTETATLGTIRASTAAPTGTLLFCKVRSVAIGWNDSQTVRVRVYESGTVIVELPRWYGGWRTHAVGKVEPDEYGTKLTLARTRDGEDISRDGIGSGAHDIITNELRACRTEQSATISKTEGDLARMRARLGLLNELCK